MSVIAGNRATSDTSARADSVSGVLHVDGMNTVLTRQDAGRVGGSDLINSSITPIILWCYQLSH